MPLLEVHHLTREFSGRGGLFARVSGAHAVRAVDDVSFSIRKGETLGLVGESGSGKSTIGRLLTRLVDPTDGEMLYQPDATGAAPRDLAGLSQTQFRPLRSKIQIIFQDPYASLNPRMRIRDVLGEALDTHGLAKGSARKPRIEQLLQQVGLRPEHADRYPHEFSGGQRQRIGIARALALGPELIVGDEPVSALDVSIQAQIINLLMDLQDEFKLSYLFVAHDLAVVEHLSHRVAVMYLGRIVELTDKTTLFDMPLHPYTEALLSAVPIPKYSARNRKRVILRGDVPSPINPPAGCHFHSRCLYAHARCREEAPVLREVNPDHWAACHLHDGGVKFPLALPAGT